MTQEFYGDRALEYDVAEVIGDRGAALEEIMCEVVAAWHDDIHNTLADGLVDEDDRPAFQERLDACDVFLENKGVRLLIDFCFWTGWHLGMFRPGLRPPAHVTTF